MKLSRYQINFIEEYLIKNKVKFWDVRMELLDHIATDVQERMHNGEVFENALKQVHLSFGNSFKSKKLSTDQKSWIFTESIYADNSGYKKLMQLKHIELNKSLRRELRFAIIRFFKNPLLVALFVGFGTILYYTLSNGILSIQMAFHTLLFLLLFISMVPFIIIAINQKKALKSLYLSTLSSLPFLFVGFFNIIQFGFTVSSSNLELNYGLGYILFTFAVLFPFVFVQIQVFLRKFREYQKIHKTYFA